MKTARYNFRFYPTDIQRAELAQTFGCARFVYNWGVQLGRDSEKVPSFGEYSKRLTQLKKQEDTSWLRDVSSVALQQSLRNLSTAWERCFKKLGKRPTFKSRRGKQGVTFTKGAMRVEGQVVHLSRITGPLDIRWSRSLPSEPSSCAVTLDPSGRYHISFVVQLDPEELPRSDSTVGVDLGLTHFAILSNGEKIENPKFLGRDLKRLALAQRDLARKKKGSNNRAKARKRVARIHAKIADKRKDFLHKLSTRLIRENQAIAVETLSVKNMLKNKNLSRAISDAGWGMFVEMLEYKSDWYGRDLVKIDRWFPSTKTCSNCSRVAETIPLSTREWICDGCKMSHDRDINAAINIKIAAGLAVCGEASAGLLA